MFDLDREVSQWCHRTCPRPYYRKSQITELEDHLHCAVARLVAQDVPTEEAFRLATLQLGETESLRAEYRKNWSWLTTKLRRIEGQALQWYKSIQLNGMLVRQRSLRFSAGLLVAGVAFAVFVFLRDTETAQWTQSMLVALYSLPFMLFGAAA